MSKQFAVVELKDGTITSITLDKYLASQMKIIEECDESNVKEQVAYWDRIYHYKEYQQNETKLIYHFYNKKRNTHLWSVTNDKTKLKGIRHLKEYELVSDDPTQPGPQD